MKRYSHQQGKRKIHKWVNIKKRKRRLIISRDDLKLKTLQCDGIQFSSFRSTFNYTTLDQTFLLQCYKEYQNLEKRKERLFFNFSPNNVAL